ncbi:hypothetical protein DRP53_09095 [candidate division WOR-3 bacterium]|uniref:histidine kinase n=1 Tax=candidate division WOR-3 bacterium TaxID=2052148 RepID=A0A660SF32_UNCW3|nr:MAG: hypothetical protein DRP53_09095 [candidate division WOR-3 bacterium]
MIVTKMATIVSHELKNSLSTIMGLIRSGGVEEKKLNHEIKRMLEFLDRISLFTRPIKVKNELICLNYLILDVLQDFRTATETVLEFNSSDELRITTDPVILEHILKNIIKNSIDALDGRGKIQIDLEKKPEKVSISIADDGPGIPPEDLKKIFQPFYTTKPDGTGLGLAIVKRFSEAIGAEVSVSSKPGRGTRFILELPNV